VRPLEPKIDTTKPVKIRVRGVVYSKPSYGRFTEYQVVQGRTILSRHELRKYATKWCEERRLTVELQ
jgi:hypothetical protein